ncbi:MAG: carboxymuconolactone decarboxylase family protein [Burkholderiaceae bacterium]
MHNDAATAAQDMGDFERGLDVRRQLFGPERVQQAFANPDPLTQKFQRLMTSACFGAVWGDESMARPERSLVTMAIVAAQHRFVEFEAHVRLALRNGCSATQLEQLVMHLTVYCGVPTGGEAFRIVDRVLREGAASAPAAQ